MGPGDISTLVQSMSNYNYDIYTNFQKISLRPRVWKKKDTLEKTQPEKSPRRFGNRFFGKSPACEQEEPNRRDEINSSFPSYI